MKVCDMIIRSVIMFRVLTETILTEEEVIKVQFREQMISKMLHFGKEHKIFKYPVLAFVTGYFACHHVVQMVLKERYRYFALVSAVLIFLVSSSFTDPIQTELFAAETVAIEENVEGALRLSRLPEETMQADELQKADDIANDEVLIYDENEKPVEASFEEDWKLILVNKQNMVPEDYSFELGTIRGSIQADVRILDALSQMIDAAKKDGVTLTVCSGCRDYNRQTVLFDKKIRNYMGRGMSYFDAYSIASQAVTIPGKSEHQIGLALDIISNNYSSLNEGFADTAAGKWLAANSDTYGFILRYPKGKENITGIEYEPWHFRYVGQEAAKAITEQGITLEEYVEQIGLK